MVTLRNDRVKEKHTLKKKAPRGSYRVTYERNSGINFISVIDSKEVSVLSTAAGVTPLKPMKIYSRITKKCEHFFHTSETVNKCNAGCPLKIISNSPIICHGHPNVALTSNLPYGELSSEAKQLIAQIKGTAKKQVKQEIISKIYIQKQQQRKGTK